MTDQTPRTEAGRREGHSRIWVSGYEAGYKYARADALREAAQARADSDINMKHAHLDGYRKGRAEALERLGKVAGEDVDIIDGAVWVRVSAVRAILAAGEKP